MSAPVRPKSLAVEGPAPVRRREGKGGSRTSEDGADAVLVGALGRGLVARLEGVGRECDEPVEDAGHGTAEQGGERVQLAVGWQSAGTGAWQE